MPPLALSLRRLLELGRVLLILTAFVAGGAPLAADWLSLRDGSEIETAGRWRAANGLVTFELAGRTGRYSLRAAEVDFARSEELTRQRAEEARRAATKAPAAAPERRQPVLVLTDRDVRKVERQPPPPAAEADGDAVPEAPPPAVEEPASARHRLQSGLEVSRWTQRLDPATGAVVVEGEVRNTGEDLAIGLALTVALTDGDGAVVASRPALLSATTLAPRQRTRFRAEFTEPVDFANVEFAMDPVGIAAVHIREPYPVMPLAALPSAGGRLAAA